MASDNNNPDTKATVEKGPLPEKSVEEMLNQAIALHKSGNREQSERHYREVLEVSPNHGRCHYYLGLLYSQHGDLEQAQQHMARGLDLDSISPEGYINLGNVYARLNQPEKAVASFKHALALDPKLADACVNLGQLYLQKGNIREAETYLRQALEHDPNATGAGVNLGALLRLKGNMSEAEEVLRKVIELAPDLAAAHNNLGIVLHEENRLLDAFMALKQALEIDPDYVDAYNNMGSVFRDQNQVEPALACYSKALSLDETYVDAHNNKGVLLQNIGNWREAEIHFRRANALKPDYPPALTNLANILHKSDCGSEAKALYEHAIDIDPAYPEAHFGLAELLLYRAEDLPRGWQEYFWRWKKKELEAQWRPFECPVWQGEPVAGKTILVWGEQGVGEEILYATMIPDLIGAGAKTVVECERRLLPLFQTAFPKAICYARGQAMPDDIALDFHSATADLGRWLRPDKASFKRENTLFNVPRQRVEELRQRYKSMGNRPVIGISWSSKNPEMGWEKSISLADWAPLLSQTLNATFVDLQYGDTQAERSTLEAETGLKLTHDDEIDQLSSLDDFAAQVAAMDLVISVSNTTVHMAGALGVPTWTLLSSAPLWRWFKDEDQCLWYPSVTFFRQTQQSNWDDVIQRVAVQLREKFN